MSEFPMCAQLLRSHKCFSTFLANVSRWSMGLFMVIQAQWISEHLATFVTYMLFINMISHNVMPQLFGSNCHKATLFTNRS
eukprot:08741.XXX_111569_111811_1 [CDS] Oithona nana genome sequencing.